MGKDSSKCKKKINKTISIKKSQEKRSDHLSFSFSRYHSTFYKYKKWFNNSYLHHKIVISERWFNDDKLHVK